MAALLRGDCEQTFIIKSRLKHENYSAINLHTPRTRRACEELGIDMEMLKKRPPDFFGDGTTPLRVKQLRADHHNERVNMLVQRVMQKRAEYHREIPKQDSSEGLSRRKAYEILCLDEINNIGRAFSSQKAEREKPANNSSANRNLSGSDMKKLTELESDSSEGEETNLMPFRTQLKKKINKLKKDQAFMKRMESQIVEEEERRKKFVEKWQNQEKSVAVKLLRKQFEVELKRGKKAEKKEEAKLEILESKEEMLFKERERMQERKTKIIQRKYTVEANLKKIEETRFSSLNKEIRLREEFLSRREHSNEKDQKLMEQIMEKIKKKFEKAARRQDALQKARSLAINKQNQKEEETRRRAQAQFEQMSKENIDKLVYAEIKTEKAKLKLWKENLEKERRRNELKEDKMEKLEELKKELEEARKERRVKIIKTQQVLDKMVDDNKESARQKSLLQREIKNLVHLDQQQNLEIQQTLTKQKIDKFIQKHRQIGLDLRSRKSYMHNLSLADHYFNLERESERTRVLAVESELARNPAAKHTRSQSASVISKKIGRKVLKSILPTKYYENLQKQAETPHSRAASSNR